MPCQNCCLYYMEEKALNIYMELLMALCQGQYPEIHNMGSLCLGRKSNASPSVQPTGPSMLPQLGFSGVLDGGKNGLGF